MTEVSSNGAGRATWTQEAVLVAGITAAGYWVAFLYEAGYCRYFDIPTRFVDVAPTSILIAIVGVLAGIQTLQVVLLEPVLMLTKGAHPLLRRSVVKMILLGVLVFAWGVIAKFKLVGFAITGGFYALLLFMEYGLPLITQRNVQGYAKKYLAQLATDDGAGATTKLLAEHIGFEKYRWLLGGAVLSFASYFAGGFDAKGKMDFMVLKDAPDRVLLKKSGDNFLSARFDRSSKRVFPEFRLVEESDGLQINVERLGPLEPVGLDREVTQPAGAKS